MTRDLLAGVPIAGVVGVNGAGKTLWGANSAIQAMKAGRQVVSTVPIVSEWGNSEPVLSLRQLTELHDCLLFLDDVAVIFSSRTSSSLPPEIDVLIQTARHRKVTIIWTAPAWQRCDNRLREVTQAVLSVTPLFKRKVADDPWPTPGLTMAGLLDTSSGATDATPTSVMRRGFAVPRKMDSWGAYDTHADTPLLGAVHQSGVCMDCGGSRVRPKHDQARHDMLGIPWYPSDLDAKRAVAVAFDEPDELTPELVSISVDN